MLQTTSTVGKNLGQLSVLRAVAALLVVCFHTQLVIALPKYFGDETFSIFRAGKSGVQLFFVLSGFVIYLAHSRDGTRDLNVIKKFAWKRFIRLYPTLWITLFLLLPIVLSGKFGETPNVWNIISSFLILPAKNEYLLAVEWTLRHEVLFYALFVMFLWDRMLGAFVLFSWGIIGTTLGVLLERGWVFEFLFDSNHALFLMGMAAAWCYKNERMPGALLALGAGSVVFAATYAMKLSHAVEEDLSNILFGAGATGIVYGLVANTRFSGAPKFVDMLANSSYAMYLTHFPLISVMVKIFIIISQSHHIDGKIIFIIIVASSQLSGVLFYSYIERPLLAWLRNRGHRVLGARATV